LGAFGATPGTATTTGTPTATGGAGYAFGAPTATTPAAAAPKFGLGATTAGGATPAAAGSSTPATTGTATSAAPTAADAAKDEARARTALQRKNMQDILGEWSKELENHGREFIQQASRIREWDMRILENGFKLNKVSLACTKL